MIHRGSLTTSGAPLVGEEFHELVRVQNVVIEEIVSSALPDSLEYRQPHDEWVVVLEGSASLDVDGTESDVLEPYAVLRHRSSFGFFLLLIIFNFIFPLAAIAEVAHQIPECRLG